MADAVWVIPSSANTSVLMAQLVLNAAVTAAATDNGPQLVTYWTKIVRGNIQRGGLTPLSQGATEVPPTAERYIYVLVINDLTAGTPNLGTVVVTMNGGVVSPWNDLVKAAKAYVDSLLKVPVEYPSLPMQAGHGCNLGFGLVYPATLSLTIPNLQVGVQYYFNPGPNEARLVCGSTSLTAAGSFYAPATSAVITGVSAASGQPFTGQLQRSKDAANQASSRRIRGRYDMETFGPVGSWYGSDPEDTPDVNVYGTL